MRKRWVVAAYGLLFGEVARGAQDHNDCVFLELHGSVWRAKRVSKYSESPFHFSRREGTAMGTARSGGRVSSYASWWGNVERDDVLGLGLLLHGGLELACRLPKAARGTGEKKSSRGIRKEDDGSTVVCSGSVSEQKMQSG